MPPEGPPENRRNRWYDADPVLQRAIEQLRTAPDKYQAQIALNIIKIVIEHQMENETDIPAEELEARIRSRRPAADGQRTHRRWYDVHETLSSAMQLLADCPDDLQTRVIPSIAGMIEQTLDGHDTAS